MCRRVIKHLLLFYGHHPANRFFSLPQDPNTKGNIYMHPEIYIAAPRYDAAVERITAALQQSDPLDVDTHFAAARVALSTACLVDLGELVFEDTPAGRRVAPEHYRDLVAALAALEPKGHAEIDFCQVKEVLGEVGNIWSEAIRADVEAEGVRERANEQLGAR
jgi:hypothetical protein